MVRLIDFGLARVPGIEEEAPNDPAGVPGTPSYMAPELLTGASRGDAQTDVYALGVTLYRMFSGGAFPYGENKSFSPPRTTAPTHLTRHRMDLPAWLDATLLRAAALPREDRFADPIDLVLALETGESFRPVHVQRSLYGRNPLLFWKGGQRRPCARHCRASCPQGLSSAGRRKAKKGAARGPPLPPPGREPRVRLLSSRLQPPARGSRRHRAHRLLHRERRRRR